MVELKDRQQKETEHKLQSHSCLTLMEQVLGSLLDSDLSILLRKPSSDQARRIAGQKRERRRGLVELKDRQQ